MKTITIEYNERNKIARQFVEFILSAGLVRHRKTGIEEALEDVEKGNLRTVLTPEKRKAKK